MTFWPLVFPLILGTFFFFAFGNLNDADFETVQVALVRETTDNPLFDFTLIRCKKVTQIWSACMKWQSKKLSRLWKTKKSPEFIMPAWRPPWQSTHTESRKVSCSLFWKVMITVCTPYGRFWKNIHPGSWTDLHRWWIPVIWFRRFPWVEKQLTVLRSFFTLWSQWHVSMDVLSASALRSRYRPI